MDYLFHDINAWLKRYHSDLALDSSGYCYLNVEKSLTVVISLTPDKKTLTLYCPLLALADGGDSSLAFQALKMNLYQNISSHGILGYDESVQQLVYSTVLSGSTSESVSEKSFHGVLNDFISNSQKLAQHFAQLSTQKNDKAQKGKPGTEAAASRPSSLQRRPLMNFEKADQ